MQRHVFFGCAGIVVASFGLVVACGDDDNNSFTPTPDGGSSSGSTSSGSTSSGATSGGTSSGTSGSTSGSTSGDAAVTTTPLLPQAIVRMNNAVNPYGVVFGSDGMIYAAGSTVDAGVRKLAVWRLKDGAIDATFANNAGILTSDLPGDEAVFDMVEVSNGNFLIDVTSGGKVWLVKFNSTAATLSAATFVKFGYDENEGWPVGTPNMPATAPSYQSWGVGIDRTVAASPKVVVFAHGAPAKAALVADQRIDNDRWITRLAYDTLAFDPTFNGGSPYTVDADGKKLGDNSRRGFVTDTGAIVSSGYTNFGTGSRENIVLIKLKADGTADNTFGFGTNPAIPGQARINPFAAGGGSAEAYNIARQSDGKIITGGYGVSNFDVASKGVDLISTRLTLAGDGLDTTFGRMGVTAFQSESDKTAGLGNTPHVERARDLVILPDDRIVYGGAYDDFTAIYITDKNGKLDPSTGQGTGFIEYNFAGSFFRIVRSPDGKQIAAVAQSVSVPVDGGTQSNTILATLKVGP